MSLPVGCRANHQLAAWLHGHCPPVWFDPTGPNQDTDLPERKDVRLTSSCISETITQDTVQSER